MIHQKIALLLAVPLCFTATAASGTSECESIFRAAGESKLIHASIATGKTALPDYIPREQILRKVAETASRNLPVYSLSRYGRENGPLLLRRLEALGNGFSILVVDPGIVQHLDGFSAYLERFPELKSADPWHARSRFREYLGKIIVYRALALSPIEKIQMEIRRSVDSALLRGPSKSVWADFYQAAASLVAHRNRHVRGKGTELLDAINPLISVTDFRDVAIAVANDFANQRQDASVYVVTLELNLLDVFDPVRFTNGGLSKSVLVVDRFQPNGLDPEARYREYTDDSRLESFVLNRIHGTEIVSIDQVSVTERAYRFHWK